MFNWGKKKKIDFAQEEKKIDRTMPEHMRVIYKTWPKDRMVLGNCPHCQCIMLTLHDKKFVFFCPSCAVYWHIKLIENPMEGKHGLPEGSDGSDQRHQ